MCLDVVSITLAFGGRPGRSVELAMRTSMARDAVSSDVRDPVIIASGRRFLAWYLTLDQRWSESLATYERAESEIAAALGPRHHVMGLARGGMAFCHLELGDIQKADALSQEAMELTAENPAASRDQIGIVEFFRGVVLVRLGRGEEAIPLLENSWDRFFAFTPHEFTWRERVIRDALVKIEIHRTLQEIDVLTQQIEATPDMDERKRLVYMISQMFQRREELRRILESDTKDFSWLRDDSHS